MNEERPESAPPRIAAGTVAPDVAARLDEASAEGLGRFSQMGCGVAAQHVWLQGFSALTRTNDVDFVEVLEGYEDG